MGDSSAIQEPPGPAPNGAHPVWPSGANRGITKVRYTHDAMINLIIDNPCVSQNQLAAHFGYSPGWVSQIIASDAFQARLAERTGELVDPTIRQDVETRFKAMVIRSLEILQAHLNKSDLEVPPLLALRAMEVSSRAAGYGARPEAPKVEVNVENHLNVLGENLTALLRRKRAELVDVTPADPKDRGIPVLVGNVS